MQKPSQSSPSHLDFSGLSPALIAEITEVLFGPSLEPEFYQKEEARCDVIFVFGGSHPGLWEKAAEAYWRGLGREIIVTGGHKINALGHPTRADGDAPEAQVIRRELIRLGVPAERTFCEDRSTNTLENVLFAQQVYDFSRLFSILAVCKSYAVGRQVRTLRWHVDRRVRIIPYPFNTHIGGNGPFVTRQTWMNFPEARTYLLDNLLKIDRYGRQGHLEPAVLSPELTAWVKAAHLR